MPSLSPSRRLTIAATALTVGLVLSVLPQSAAETPELPEGTAAGDTPWVWPVQGTHRIIQPFVAPAHDYGPGHRGMDVGIAPGQDVRAPFDGVVAFRGTVVDRPLLTIEHPEGYVLTLEPVQSSLKPGTTISRGDQLGSVATGGHTEPGALHIGVRIPPDYLNPRPFFGDVERAILLPCCGSG